MPFGLKKRGGFGPTVGGKTTGNFQETLRGNAPGVGFYPRHEVQKWIQFHPERRATVHLRLNGHRPAADKGIRYSGPPVFRPVPVQNPLDELGRKPLDIRRPAVNRLAGLG